MEYAGLIEHQAPRFRSKNRIWPEKMYTALLYKRRGSPVLADVCVEIAESQVTMMTQLNLVEIKLEKGQEKLENR